MLNLQTGQYHGLNQTAGRMLELLGEIGDIDLTAQKLSEEVGESRQTVEKDLEILCEALSQRGLVDIDRDA